MSKTGDGERHGLFDELQVNNTSAFGGNVVVGTPVFNANVTVFGNVTVTGSIIIPVTSSNYFSATDATLQYRTATGGTFDFQTTSSATPTFNFKNSAGVTTASTLNAATGNFTAITVTSSTVVANLNSSQLLGATWASPDAIGSGVAAAGTFTSLTTPGVITSTYNSGAPFVITSSTVVANLNASQLLGKTWGTPDPIGATVKNTGAFTSMAIESAIVAGLTVGTVGTNQNTLLNGNLVVTGTGL